MKNLKPPQSEADSAALKAYDLFNDKYRDIISVELRKSFDKDSFLNSIIENTDPEEQKRQQQQSLKLQKDAIHNGEWQAYSEYLLQQGITYAQMGLSFSDWFNIIKVYRDYAYPYILKEFSDLEQVMLVIEGMNKVIDYALRIIAEAYFIEKNNLIQKEEKVKEKALKAKEESDERFRAIFENTRDHIFMVNKDYIVQFINHVAPGFNKEDILNRNLLTIRDEKYQKKVKKAIDHVFATGTPSHYEIESQGTRETLYYQASVSPMFRNGKVYGAAIVSRNITQQKKAQLALKELNQNLEQKVEERTQSLKEINAELESFSYSVSHDLRAPLRAISGYTRMLEKKLGSDLSDDQQRYMNVIVNNVEKMGQLIDDLLAFSRMGKVAKTQSVFDPGQLAHQVYNELTQAGQHKPVKLLVKPMPKLRADREMMKYAFANLIGNSLKFSVHTENPCIEIGSETKEGETVFYIRDNGAGFEMEYVDKLFGMFQRLHSDDEFEGTGVGLAIVQRIIHRHDGKIWAESIPGKGATFYFTIPQI